MVRSAQVSGVDARLMDAQALQFTEEFNAVFTNAALHWMPQIGQVVAGVWRSLRPHGRFVGEMGGSGNVATIVAALRDCLGHREFARLNPWYFPDAEAFTAVLSSHGFHVNQVHLFPRRTALPGDVNGWLETFAQPFLSTIDPSNRQKVMAALVDELRPSMCDTSGRWWADYVRLRFHATKEA